jgi:hypothetical protein
MPRLNIYSEVLARYGNAEQQKRWLVPLLNGEIRSAFAMTERYGAFWDHRSESRLPIQPTCKLHHPTPRTFARPFGRKGMKLSSMDINGLFVRL